ncbi:hypothetical protein DFQ29_009919 [Apophysomyces sp. BC1021]|nr:hypothetical protein DFQ29_009919 [Apophysomyces sp. BC1021]
MVVYTSSVDSAPLPDVDLYTLLFEPQEIDVNRPRDHPLLIDATTGKTLTLTQVHDLSSRIASDEFLHQIRSTKAKAVVTVPSLLPTLSAVCAQEGVPQENIFLFGSEEVDGYKSFYSLMDEQGIQSVQGINSSDDVAFICFSSGTTGLPKGVMLTHRNFISNLVQSSKYKSNSTLDDEVTLGFLPFFHIFGVSSLVLRTFLARIPLVVMSKYDLETMCQFIEKYKVTRAAVVPPIVVQLVKNDIVGKYDLSSLRFLGCGAAPLGREHVEGLKRRIGITVAQGYGLTETTGGCFYQDVEDEKDLIPGSSGKLTAFMEAKIVDENGQSLGPDLQGELLVRGPQVMKGYLNNPEANKETFTADGWMRTGDIVKYDSVTGEFFVLDRIKELIKYNGFQVAPAELEALLMSHDAIADCCVVGVHDFSQATELPRAYVVVRPTVQPSGALAADIVDFVAANVTNYKRLRAGVRFVDQIPKSTSGKILRREVKLWTQQEQQEIRGTSRL